jgi:hypothetical protein
MVSQIERVLLTLQDWSRDGLASIDDPAAFNRLLIPIIQQRSIVSSIHLASDAGREILLLKTPEGWKNRITDVPKKGKQQHWLTWKDAQTRTGEEWKEQDYDPRKRPWFAGALATPENQIHWTAPYIFQSTRTQHHGFDSLGGPAHRSATGRCLRCSADRHLTLHHPTGLWRTRAGGPSHNDGRCWVCRGWPASTMTGAEAGGVAATRKIGLTLLAQTLADAGSEPGSSPTTKARPGLST